MAGLPFILKSRFFPPADVTTSFENKNVIVTGSNTGVGFEAAAKFAHLGASTVILAVRNLEKGQRAKEAIESRGEPGERIKVWELDMDSYQSIEAFAKRVEVELAHLDVAVLNAGVVSRNFRVSPDGWEEEMQVNLLSTTLLAILLLPKLRASKTPITPAHLAVVASTGYLDVKELKPAEKNQLLHAYNTEKGYHFMGQYSTSKLFMMWVTRELAKRCVAPDGEPTVIINDCCPGPCRTEVLRDFDGGLIGILKGLVAMLLFKPPEQGSRTVVASTLLGKESQGKFWYNGEIKVPGEYIASDAGKQMQKDMWSEVIEVLRQKVPQVDSILAELP